MTISYAMQADLPSWMKLVRLLRWNFPGLETEEALSEYEKTLRKNIGRSSAICAKDHEQIVGILLFSTQHNELSCIAVHPDYRRRGIVSMLIGKMLPKLDATRDITVSAFREEDPKGNAPRALYQKLGFKSGELIEEFGYPNQKFILRANLHAKETPCDKVPES